MTLQQIADYAMEYLDGKGVAADYEIVKEFIEVTYALPSDKVNASALNQYVKASALDKDLILHSFFDEHDIILTINAELNLSK